MEFNSWEKKENGTLHKASGPFQQNNTPSEALVFEADKNKGTLGYIWEGQNMNISLNIYYDDSGYSDTWKSWGTKKGSIGSRRKEVVAH